jgi:hypothetical protein
MANIAIALVGGFLMRTSHEPNLDPRTKRTGKVGWVILWLLGIPIPVLLILFLIRGCT